MDIQESIEKIQSLYNELKEEVDGKLTPTGLRLPPSSASFCSKVDELIEEVKRYSELDDSFYIAPILHTLDKEVSDVKNYAGNRKSLKKQREELEAYMYKAIHQISLDLCTLIRK